MRETRSSRGRGGSARGSTKTPALEKKTNKKKEKLEAPKKNLVARGRRIAVDLPNKKTALKQPDDKNMGTSGDKSVHSGKESPQSSVTPDKASSQNSRSPRGRKTPALEKKASKQKEKLETANKNSVEKEGRIAIDLLNEKTMLKKLDDNMGTSEDKSVHLGEENAQSSVTLDKVNSQNKHQVGNEHVVSSKIGLVKNEKEHEAEKDYADLIEDEEVLRMIAALEEVIIDFPELNETSETEQSDVEKPCDVNPQIPCDVDPEKKPCDVEPEKKPCNVDPEKKHCDVEPDKKPSNIELEKPCDAKSSDVKTGKRPGVRPEKPSDVGPERDVEQGKSSGVEPEKPSDIEPQKTDVDPGKPPDGKPEKPDSNPRKPSDVDPRKPFDVEAEKPSAMGREKFSGVDSGKPSVVQPEKPDGKPRKPSNVQPEKPCDVELEKSSAVEPGKPSDVEPGKPSNVKPEKPSDVPKCNNNTYKEIKNVVKSLENYKKEEKPLQTKEVGGLTKHGPYSRILFVGDSRMQSLEEFWPEYPFIKPQFLIEPHLKLEELEDFILSHSELPRLENGTLLICNVGLYDIIELVDFGNCASVRNHKPLKIMALTEDRVEDIINLTLMRLKEAYKKLEDILGSSSVISFSAIIPPNPITHFFEQARNHFPIGHTTMSGLLRDNLDRVRSKIQVICTRVNKHLEILSRMPSIYKIMSSYHLNYNIVGQAFDDGLNMSLETSRLLASRLNKFLIELFYGIEINTNFVNYKREKKVVVVGDSRMMLLQEIWLGDRPQFYCEPNLGFYNFSKFIDRKLLDLKDKIVIVCLGLNDLIHFVNNEACLGKHHKPSQVALSLCERYSSTEEYFKKIRKDFKSSFSLFCTRYPALVFFATVYPIHIDNYMNSQVKIHKEKTGHVITPTRINPEVNAKLNELVHWLNSLIKDVCREHSLPFWDMFHVVCRGSVASASRPYVLKDGIYPSERIAEELNRSFFPFARGKLIQKFCENVEYKFLYRSLPTCNDYPTNKIWPKNVDTKLSTEKTQRGVDQSTIKKTETSKPTNEKIKTGHAYENKETKKIESLSQSSGALNHEKWKALKEEKKGSIKEEANPDISKHPESLKHVDDRQRQIHEISSPKGSYHKSQTLNEKKGVLTKEVTNSNISKRPESCKYVDAQKQSPETSCPQGRSADFVGKGALNCCLYHCNKSKTLREEEKKGPTKEETKSDICKHPESQKQKQSPETSYPQRSYKKLKIMKEEKEGPVKEERNSYVSKYQAIQKSVDDRQRQGRQPSYSQGRSHQPDTPTSVLNVEARTHSSNPAHKLSLKDNRLSPFTRSEDRRPGFHMSERHPYSEKRRYPLPSSERQPHSEKRRYPLPLSERSRSPFPGSSSWSPMYTGRSRSPEHYPERGREDKESHYNLEEAPWSKIGSALEAFTESNRRIRKQCQKEKDPIYQDALVDLFSTHARECELYLDKPDAHPDYFKEYRLFLDKKRDFIMKLGGDPETYDYIEEWGKIWPSRLYDLFQNNWEVKKKECLSMISSKRKRSSSSSSSSRSPTPGRVTKRSENMTSKPKKCLPKREKEEVLEDSKNMMLSRQETKKLREPNEQFQSVPYGEKVSSSQKVVKKKVVRFVEVLGILAYMKDKLGVFRVPVKVLYEKAVEMEKKGLNPNTLLEDEETAVLFAMLSDKLNSLIKGGDGSAIQKAIIQEARTHLLDLITEINKIKKKDDKKLSVNVGKIACLTKGKSISDTITTINYFLAYEGYSNVSKEDLENLYMSVKNEQLKSSESTSSSQSNRFLSSPSGFDRAEQKTVESKIPGQGTKSSPSRDVGFSKPTTVKASTSKFDYPVEPDVEFFTGKKFLRPSDSIDSSRTEVTLKSTYVPHKHALPPPAPIISGIHSSVLLKNSSSQSAQNPFCRTLFHSLQNSKQ